MLDLLGVCDAPEIQHYLALTFGNSLLQPELDDRTLALTNCAEGSILCPGSDNRNLSHRKVACSLRGLRDLSHAAWLAYGALPGVL